MKHLSTDTAHRLVWVAAGEDKKAGSALVTAGKNREVEIFCLISEEGGCGLLAIVLHTDCDKSVECHLTKTHVRMKMKLKKQLERHVHSILLNLS